MTVRGLIAGAATALSVLTFGAAAHASTWVTSGTNADGLYSASAVINAAVGSLTINLSSLIANPTSSGQNVSGIRIFFSNDPTGASLFSSAGTLIEISGAGVVSPGVGPINHWGTAISGGDLFLATAGTGSVGGQPHNLIIGSGPYTNANPSITNRGPHIQNTGTFVVNLTGQAGLPQITGVNILFGTSSTVGVGSCTAGCGAVPEPATWAMMVTGFGGMGALVRRRRRQPALAA